MLLHDTEIRRLAEHGLISPFCPESVRGGCISYGLSSAGYDIRLADEFLVPARPGAVLDPKQVDPTLFQHVRATSITVPPQGFVLARSLETIRMPRDVLGIVLGKSTYARCGIVVNCTPLEPGWEGTVTMEISNTSPFHVVLYPGEGIAQILFLRTAEPPSRAYHDRKGPYQHQTGITLPIVLGKDGETP